MSILSGELKAERNNKKLQDLINRFEYYSSSVSQSYKIGSGLKTSEQLSHFTAEIGNSEYHLLRTVKDPYNHQSFLTKPLLQKIVRESLHPDNKNYQEQSISKIKTRFESKITESAYPNILGDIVVIEKEKERSKVFSSRVNTVTRSQSGLYCNSKGQSKDYTIWVIHFPKENTNIWSYFVEKIELKEDKLSQQNRSFPIEYQSIICFPRESWMQKNIKSWFQASAQSKELTEMRIDIQRRLNLFQSKLARDLSHLVNQELQQQKNCHPEFKREAKLPAEEYKKFQKLKQQTYQYYSSIYQHKKINRYFLDNLICRFMMVKKYDQKESGNAIKKYLDWEKKLRSKYTYSSFNHYHPWKVFQYIGKDYEGRPILFFRAINYKPDRITNWEEYSDFNSYMFELYLQDHMEGYIDQYILIADYTGFSTQNFQMAFAREFSDIGGQYFPERQHKLILFGVGSFGEWIFKMLRPFLPEFILRKVAIFGTDRQEFKNFLKQYLNADQLPKYVFQDATTEQNDLTPVKKY